MRALEAMQQKKTYGTNEIEHTADLAHLLATLLSAGELVKDEAYTLTPWPLVASKTP